jgi:hypothetical protein
MTEFNDRGLEIWRDSEYASPNYYRVVAEDQDQGLVLSEMSASKSFLLKTCCAGRDERS